MFKYFKTETKSEKEDKKSNTIITNTRINGNSATSVIQNQSNSYKTASHAASKEFVQSSLFQASNDTRLLQNFNMHANADKTTFKAAPPRSAFTSTPLTVKTSNKKTFVDGKPLNVTLPPVASITPNHPTPSQLLNSSATPAKELRIKLQIKVKKSEKFYDNPNSVVPVYKTRNKRRGKLLLINNIKFINEKAIRKGAELDESNTYELFRQLGFEIIRHRNLNKKDLESKVIAFRNDKTLVKVDIAAVIIMSHGTGTERSDSTEIACTDGETLATTWIINQFDNILCSQLDGKPKIFIFQCCRGDQRDIQYDAIPFPVSRKLSDMLIAYATVPGFVAHRDPVHGTWYIQAICKVFMEHAHNTDVESLLKIVDSKLASLVANHGSKQTTSFENRGFKTCYLHPQLFEN